MEIKESEVMAKISNLINFIKSQISSDLLKAKNSDLITADMEQLQRISSIVETSIQTNFIKSSKEVTDLFKNS